MTNKGRKPVRETIEQNKGPGERSLEDQLQLHPVVEQLIIQGLNDSEIARQTGLDRKAVAHLRKKTRPAKRHPVTGGVSRGPESARVDGEILRLSAMGLSYVEIAEQLDVSWSTVRARLTKQYKEYLKGQREIAGARQTADIEMMRVELLEIIIRDDADVEINQDEIMDALSNGEYGDILRKLSAKNKAAIEAKFKAMEVLIKLMDREAKNFGLDAASNVNVNHNVTVNPESIELLQRLKTRHQEIDNTIDAEVIDVEFDMDEL